MDASERHRRTVDFANETEVLPTRGWQDGQFEGADDIGIAAVRELAREREYPNDDPGGYRVETDAGESIPRGATAMTLGAGLGIDEFDAVADSGRRVTASVSISSAPETPSRGPSVPARRAC